MEMDVATRDCFDRLVEGVDQYDQWRKPLTDLQKPDSDDYSEKSMDAFRTARDELYEKLVAAHDPFPELDALLEAMCDRYAGTTAGVRSAIRNGVSERKGLGDLFSDFGYRSSLRLRPTGDRGLLKLSLTALWIDNCSSDFRDTTLILCVFFLRARKAGIDPFPELSAVSDLSADTPTRGGCQSMAKLIGSINEENSRVMVVDFLPFFPDLDLSDT